MNSHTKVHGKHGDFAIEGKALVKRFKSGKAFIEVLKGVDFDARHGDLTMVMGPSGSGKSTLIAALSGPVLRERVGWRRWTAVLIGFVGVLIILEPGVAVFSPWALVPLALAEKARWELRDARLDRACAGFEQPVAVTPDTEQLALGLLHAAWPWQSCPCRRPARRRRPRSWPSPGSRASRSRWSASPAWPRWTTAPCRSRWRCCSR